MCVKGIGRWIVPLSYPLRDGGTLARPTQLDAGWYAYHFPSPPQASLSTGGHTVDLDVLAAPGRLVPEFIHKQVPHPLQHWTAAGRHVGRTTRTGALLAAQRQAHLGRLTAAYGPAVLAWMPDAM